MPVNADAAEVGPIGYLFVTIIWSVSLVSLGVYEQSYLHSLSAKLKTLLLGVGLSTVLLAGGLYLSFTLRDVPRVLFLYFVVLDGLFLGIPRAAQIWLVRMHFFKERARRVMIVGSSSLGTATASNLLKYSQIKLLGFVDDRAETGSVVAGLPVLGSRQQLTDLVEQNKPDIVVLALPAEQQAAGLELVIELQKRSVEVLIVPDLVNSGLVWIGADKLGDLLFINLNETRIKGLSRLLKRALDLVLATIGLTLLSPVMLIVALLIKLDSPGPVIFTQIRVGECCRLFKIHKFRTMSNGADKRLHEVMREVDGKLVHKHRNDPRITKIGRFLRATSLDELPNLINVLRGEMSIVGPRPELPELVAHYEPYQFGRLSVPPGMTGWWQVNGRSDKPLHLNTQEDMYYIENYSVLLDIKIIWRTIGVIFKRKGAF
jgi:exopolysaccharide biosynthesis polyprenyl glycosylphosphotransferase